MVPGIAPEPMPPQVEATSPSNARRHRCRDRRAGRRTCLVAA